MSTHKVESTCISSSSLLG